MKNIALIIKSIFAGFCIGIGAYLYLQVGGITGALLFSIGLLSILLLNYKLYTGFIGYVENLKDLLTALKIFIGNVIGCCLFPFRHEQAINLINLKMAIPLHIIFCKAIICGILIYIAIEAWKTKREWITMLAVASFILCGAEHSIADICYLVISNLHFTLQHLLMIIVIVIGNGLGSYFARLAQNIK